MVVQPVDLTQIKTTGQIREKEVRVKLLDTIEKKYAGDGKVTKDEMRELQTAVRNEESYSGKDSILLNASLELLANFNRTYAKLAPGGGKYIDKNDIAVMKEIAKQGGRFGKLKSTDILATAERPIAEERIENGIWHSFRKYDFNDNFYQGKKAGDCFFVASLLAVQKTPGFGKTGLAKMIQPFYEESKTAEGKKTLKYQVTFPGFPNDPVVVERKEIDEKI